MTLLSSGTLRYPTSTGGPMQTKSGSYTLLNTDAGVCVTAAATITLPASPIPGRGYRVKNFGSGVTVTVSTGGANVIDRGGVVNATSCQITSQGAALTFVLAPNATDWVIV